MTVLAKVTSKGQITLPKEVRELLQIRTGSIVIFEKEDEKLVVKTAKTLQDFRGVLKGRQGGYSYPHAVYCCGRTRLGA